MPSMWLCDWCGCQSPAVQVAGDCLICGRHLCQTHLGDQWHTCPKPETNWDEYGARYIAAESRRLEELCQRIDGEKLCLRAAQLRNDTNVSCKIYLSPKSLSTMMGGQNCHAEVVFSDGVVWLARFRLFSPLSPPPEVRDYVLRSEAATMQFLQHRTSIPSPRVFGWACETDPANTVGVGYILMEKLHGDQLKWTSATIEQKEKIVRQLAEIMLEIERHPFDKIGSLVATAPIPGGEMGMVVAEPQLQLKGLAQQSTFRSGKDGKPLGPFRSSREASRALVEAHIQMIVDAEIGTAENAVDLFLAHRFRLDILDRAWKTNTDLEEEKFFLKHPDDKGDHILVNADFDIVGVIDWEWCSTVSREEAFSSPCMMWPVGEFYDGSNKLTDEELLLARVFREKGREDLARCVLDGRKVQRWRFGLGPDASHEDVRTFANLFMGLKRAFDSGHAGEEEEWETWKATALEKWKDEALLQALIKKK